MVIENKIVKPSLNFLLNPSAESTKETSTGVNRDICNGKLVPYSLWMKYYHYMVSPLFAN